MKPLIGVLFVSGRMSKSPHFLRCLHWARLFWASPNTLLGLLGIALWWAAGAQVRWVSGAFEATLPASRRERPRRRHLPFTVITLGHVVLGTNRDEMERWRSHERVHVKQYERWGPWFLPAYLLASGWQWCCRRDAYWDNPFEVEARRVGGC